jgi:hypothetical protein
VGLILLYAMLWLSPFMLTIVFRGTVPLFGCLCFELEASFCIEPHSEEQVHLCCPSNTSVRQ